MERKPRILVYKRTHIGDPSDAGIFGVHGCMGRVRDWDYDAVIGVGGARPWPGSLEIAYKVNWVGIGPIRLKNAEYLVRDQGHTLVAFERFRLFNGSGPHLAHEYQMLHQYMFSPHRRLFTSDSVTDPDLYATLLRILELADNAPQSPGLSAIETKIQTSTCANSRAVSVGCE